MRVLVTGSKGFIGKNLCAALNRHTNIEVFECDIEHTELEIDNALKKVDAIIHLAGVNRPISTEDFHTGNTKSIEKICSKLQNFNKAPQILLSSSIQALLDNPYGISKRNSEKILERFSKDTGAKCVVYRFKNLFGKWCRPNYNSVTATFCHNIANDLSIQISDPSKVIHLTYIDDVIAAFIDELSDSTSGFRFAKELPSSSISLGDLAKTIRSFKELRSSLVLPDFSQPFIRALYATYLSYLEGPDFSYALEIKADERGSLAEFIKSPSFGQIFISRTKPGVTRGDHYHHTKTEKFMVVAGQAIIRFRQLNGKNIIEHQVRGEDYKVLDIPPGYTHSIENVGKSILVTIFWANEMFNPESPDTFFEAVKS